MSEHPLTWLDVFTAERLTGNQLAVVHDADGVDDATMLACARETKLSETTFVQTATAEGADYRNRIWMMAGELDFAGHPSLGTAVAVALSRGERSASYVQQTRAGLQPIDVEVGDDGVADATMLQGPATLAGEADPAAVADAVGLDAGDLDPQLPPQVASTGQPHLLAPVREHALERVRPDAERLRAVLADAGAPGGVVYLAACDAAAGTARARSFFLEPGGVGEDPATGSAVGPLMAYLHARTGADRLTVTQGVEMARPSRLECAMEGGDGRVRVGGRCVVVLTGAIRL